MTMYPGTTMRLFARFKDANRNVDTDASNVTLAVLKPSGKRDTYSGGAITHDSEGHYHVDVAIDEPGRWSYRFKGGQAGDVGEFVVEASAFV